MSERYFEDFDKEYEDGDTLRCIVCDYNHLLNPAENGRSRTFKWDERELGHVCSDCTGIINETVEDYGYDDLEPLELLEE